MAEETEQKKYDFAVWGTQGGGVVKREGDHFVFVEVPSQFPDIKVGDRIHPQWDLIPANELARNEGAEPDGELEEDFPDDFYVLGDIEEHLEDHGLTITVSCSHCKFLKSETCFETYEHAGAIGQLLAEHAKTGCKEEPDVRDPYAEACAREAGDHTEDLEYQAALNEAAGTLEKFRACTSDAERKQFVRSLPVDELGFFLELANFEGSERDLVRDNVNTVLNDA